MQTQEGAAQEILPWAAAAPAAEKHKASAALTIPEPAQAEATPTKETPDPKPAAAIQEVAEIAQELEAKAGAAALPDVDWVLLAYGADVEPVPIIQRPRLPLPRPRQLWPLQSWDGSKLPPPCLQLRRPLTPQAQQPEKTKRAS